MRKNSFQFILIRNISLGFIFVIFTVISSILFFTTNHYNKMIMGNLQNNMTNIVESVDYYFEDVKTPMVMMARNDSIIRMMKHYGTMTNREKLNTGNVLKEFVQNIATFKPFINDIIIIGENGYVYNIYNENPDKYLKNYDIMQELYFEEAKEGDIKLYYTAEHMAEHYLHAERNNSVYTVILPVRSSMRKIGYIVCDIKADTINGIIENGLQGNKAKILILDEGGELISEKGNEDIQAEEILKQLSCTKEGKTDQVTFRNRNTKNLMAILFARDNYITTAVSEPTGWTYVYAEPYENIAGFMKKILLFSIGAVVVGLAVIIFFSRQLSCQILWPLKNISFMLREMHINQGIAKGEFFNAKEQNVNEISMEIEQMIWKMDKLINENYLYEIQAKDTQIQMLVNQLSPHFLYNTLQLIEYQSYGNNHENVTKIINGLCYILRYCMSTEKIVPLKNEMEYVEEYLAIYQFRYQNKLHYSIQKEEELMKLQVPKMILEPIVENCIKHGFAGNVTDAQIWIRVDQREEDLMICVRDNGRGITEEKLDELKKQLENPSFTDEHIGLNNVNAILKLRYGMSYGVKIESVKDQYTEVMIRLPMERKTGQEI